MKSYLLFIAGFLMLLSPASYSASFDCDKASTETEKLICSDSKLGFMDEDLTSVYASLMSTYPPEERVSIKDGQRAWLSDRNKTCQSVEECRDVYSKRVDDLRKKLEAAVSYSTFTIDRQSCRASKNQKVIIKCIESEVYDPCDDAGGKWGAAQCGWAHAKIAEIKIRDLENRIIAKIQKNDQQNALVTRFQESTGSWESYRDQHCNFTNDVEDLDNFEGMVLHLAFCIRRTNEQRLQELEEIVSHSY